METLLERNIGIEKYFSYIVLKSPIVKNALPLKALLDTPQYARPDCTNHREERDCNDRFAPTAAIRQSDFIDVCFSPDSVAKVVLPKVSKILRAAGAVFV